MGALNRWRSPNSYPICDPDIGPFISPGILEAQHFSLASVLDSWYRVEWRHIKERYGGLDDIAIFLVLIGKSYRENSHAKASDFAIVSDPTLKTRQPDV